jgi:hypothetical protein
MAQSPETSTKNASADLILRNDYDVLGVGGVRRRLLESEGFSRPHELICHRDLVPSPRQAFYQSVLDETLRWFRPAAVRESLAAENLSVLLKSELVLRFPATTHCLGARVDTALAKYLAAFPWQGPLLSDHFRYFSVFLKTEKVSENYEADVDLLAQLEWLRSYLSFADFGSTRPRTNVLALNPSLQPLRLPRDLEGPEGLRKERGLYVFYQQPETLEVCEKLLDADEAAILDLLEDEAEVSPSQILQILDRDTPVVRKKLSNLCGLGIIEAGFNVLPEELL